MLIQKNVKNIKRVTTIEKNKKLLASTAVSSEKTKSKDNKTSEKKASPEKKIAKQPEKKEIKK